MSATGARTTEPDDEITTDAAERLDDPILRPDGTALARCNGCCPHGRAVFAKASADNGLGSIWLCVNCGHSAPRVRLG